MALAVDYAKLGKLKPLLINLGITMALGTIFLGVKAVEYTIDYQEGPDPRVEFPPARLELEKLERRGWSEEEPRPACSSCSTSP